jgi:hypothetical protein
MGTFYPYVEVTETVSTATDNSGVSLPITKQLGGATVKYMVMVYGDQSTWDVVGMGASDRPVWSEEHVKAMHDYMNTLNAELAASGELVLGAGLADPTQTRTVQAREGAPLVTDGPYAEAKEFLAGWWILDCDSFERVAEIAARVSNAPGPDGPMRDRVEIRPVDGDVVTA